MRYKIKFQKDNKIHFIILEAKDKESLKVLADYPTNLINITPLERKFNLNFQLHNEKKEFSELFKQLSIMLNANITINEAIELLLNSKQNGKIKEFLSTFDNAIKTSKDISQVLKAYKNDIGDTAIIFLHLGILNGNIKEALSSLVEIQSQDKKTVKKFKNILKYPFILVVSLFISILMIFIYVIPNFEYIFTLLGDNLPLSTKILIGTKDILLQYYYIIIFLSLFIVLLSLYFYSKFRFEFDKFISLKIPIISTLVKNYMFYRLFLSISIIVKSKYQFQVAIENSKNIINNLYIQKVMTNIITKIKNGSTIAESFEQSNLFDDLTIKLLYTAQYTNNYEEVLFYITNLHKEKFEESMKRFSSILEPSVILLISLMVLWLVLAVMVPIWDMGQVV